QLGGPSNVLEIVMTNKRKSSVSSKTRFIQGIVVGLSLTSLCAIATSITKPFIFSSGTTISASEVNQNFDVVYQRVNELSIGFTASVSSSYTATCSPYPITLTNLNLDSIELNDGGFTAGTYTVATNGTYILHYSVKSSTYGLEIRPTIN